MRGKNTTYEYEVSMPATVDIGSRVSGVTWYEVHTTRKADSKGTLVGQASRMSASGTLKWMTIPTCTRRRPYAGCERSIAAVLQ